MKPYTILVPLDDSRFSRQILPRVCRMFNPSTYGMLLLRVTDKPAGIVAPPPRPIAYGYGTLNVYESAHDVEMAIHPIYSEQRVDSLRAELDAQLRSDAVPLREQGYTVATIVRFGDPANEIVEVAEQEHVDLIAMATHGRTGVYRLLQGSVAEHVLHRAPVPVLLVQPEGVELRERGHDHATSAR